MGSRSKKAKKTLKEEIQERIKKRKKELIEKNRKKLKKRNLEANKQGIVTPKKLSPEESNLEKGWISKLFGSSKSKVKKKVPIVKKKVPVVKKKVPIVKKKVPVVKKKVPVVKKKVPVVKKKVPVVKKKVPVVKKKVPVVKKKVSVREKIKKMLGNKYAPYVTGGGLMTLAAAAAYLNKGKKPSGSGGGSASASTTGGVETQSYSPYGAGQTPSKPEPKPKPKPNVNLQGGQGGYGTSGGISPLLQKHVDSRGGWKAYGPKSIGSQIGKLLGEDPKASKMVDKAETTLYNSLLEKKNSDDPNVTLTSAEKAHMKKVESRKKGGMIKRNSGGKVKRNMGGKVTPRKKTVFRRGGGKALRGFGRATYSNKLY